MAMSRCTGRTHFRQNENETWHRPFRVDTEYDGYTPAFTYKHARELLVEYLSRYDRPIFLLGSGCNGKMTLLHDVCRTGELNSSWRVLQPVACSNTFARPPKNREVWMVNVLSGNYRELFLRYTFPYYMIDMNHLHPRRTHSHPRAIPVHEVIQ